MSILLKSAQKDEWMKEERNIEYVEVLEVLAHEDCSTNKADLISWCIEIISVLFSKTFL